ncbi:MAG: hypothetical protein ACE5FU_11730, partial [Nitrospinota bacterium]
MKKKILIVAYNFPPSGSVGVLRTLRFLDELSEEEWEPHVLTVKKGTFLTLEPSMNEKIKESLEVHRTKSFEAFNTISSSAGFFQKFLKDIWFYFASPDIYVGWVPYAIKKGAEILKRQEFSVIYVSGKPFSSFLIGHYLSKKMGTPWVMDLRDLWTLNKRLLPKSPFHKYFEEYLERKCVHSASRVIVNTPDNKNDYLKSFTKEPKEKFMCITNGYDQGEFDEIRKDKFEKFTIGYCGNFYVNSTKRNRSLYSRVFNPKKKKSQLFETYSPQFIFESVEQIFREVPELKDKIEFRFVGSGCKKAAEFMTEYNLEKNVKLEGWVSYKKNLEIMSR